MIHPFRKVGYSEALNVTLFKDRGITVNESYSLRLIAVADGKLLLEVRQSAQGCTPYEVTARPGELRINTRVAGRHIVPPFGATIPESVEAVPGGWNVVLPKDRMRLRKPKSGPRTVPAVPRAVPAVPVQSERPAQSSHGATSLRDAVRAVNALKDELGSDLCLSIGADGRLRAMVEYS
jgi:hypothetical protein